MYCTRLANEVYALYVLGLSDDGERAHIRGHLRQECESCRDAVKEAIAFWYLFATAPAKLGRMLLATPSPALRRRVLNAVRVRSTYQTFVPAWTWGRMAAGVAIAIGAGTSVWQLGRASLQPQLTSAQSRLQEQEQLNRALTAQNRSLETVEQSLRAAASNQGRAGAVTPARPGENELVASLQKQLEQARAAATATSQTAAGDSNRVGELERTLADRSSQLAVATRNLEDAEKRYEAAVRQTDQDRQRQDQQQTQIQASQTRIRELETQIIQFRRVVEAQQQKAAENMRLTAMLQSPSTNVVRLRATEAGQAGSGIALFTERNRLVFFASNLPAPASGRTYQLWIVRKKGPAIVSAGTFVPMGQDSPAIQFSDAALLSNISGLAVTDEPTGGSSLPTGHKWLIGTPQI